MNRRSVLSAAALLMAPDAQAQQSVDIGRLVRVLANLVEREYPDAAAGRRIARALRRARISATDPQALATLITGVMRDAVSDQHLHVSYDPQSSAMRTAVEDAPATPQQPTPSNPSQRAHRIFGEQAYGIASVRRLPGNIGYLSIDNFPPLYETTKARYGAAMTLLADTWGMVLDLRQNGGGASDTPAYLVSYFFEREPFLLDRLEWRRAPSEESRTTRILIGPNYRESRPLMVLTSSETFSAAEAVAYDLQAFGRARVVGERSRGGANPGDFFNIGQGFEAFVPQGRVINGATGGNWEGTGVQPDISASASGALSVAHRALIDSALAQAGDDTDRANALRAARGSSAED